MIGRTGGHDDSGHIIRPLEIDDGHYSGRPGSPGCDCPCDHVAEGLSGEKGKRRTKGGTKMKVVTSCEDSNTVYVDFPDVRLIFREGKYAGWYIP